MLCCFSCAAYEREHPGVRPDPTTVNGLLAFLSDWPKSIAINPKLEQYVVNGHTDPLGRIGLNGANG